jgi:hypothetical protein
VRKVQRVARFGIKTAADRSEASSMREVGTLKRWLAALGWFAVLWVGLSSIGGGVAGAMAGASVRDPAVAAQLGARAGADFAVRYGTSILLGSLLLALVGSWRGWLPGTRASSEDAPGA